MESARAYLHQPSDDDTRVPGGGHGLVNAKIGLHGADVKETTVPPCHLQLSLQLPCHELT